MFIVWLIEYNSSSAVVLFYFFCWPFSNNKIVIILNGAYFYIEDDDEGHEQGYDKDAKQFFTKNVVWKEVLNN